MMKLYTCESCRYTFRYPLFPGICPDCGKGLIRAANEKEKWEYRNMQIILEEEIRMGLWTAALTSPLT